MVANLQQPTTIPEEVRELIAQQRFCIRGLCEIAVLLPADDETLHDWLMETIAARDALAFEYLISAAAITNRRLQAGLLVGGTMLMRVPDQFAWIAWHMEGDVTASLLEALRGPGFPLDTRAMALFIAAAWWQKHREGAVPREIIAEARKLARHKVLQVDVTLGALQSLTGNAELKAILPMGRSADLCVKSRVYKDSLLAALETAAFACEVPEKETHDFSAARPMRRAVERIGRNERCRCGSGRKYKQCCATQDQHRLRLSTDVAGKTAVELQENFAPHLTRARLEKTTPAELVRMDPTQVPRDLLDWFLFRLAAFSCFDELASAFERLGVTDDLEATWKKLFVFVIKEWKPTIARRLVTAHPRGEEILPELPSGVRLLLAVERRRKPFVRRLSEPASAFARLLKAKVDQGGGSAEEFLRVAEAEAMAALQSDDEEVWQALGAALLSSPYPALGIFVARSTLPLASESNAQYVFGEILRARDRLVLSPDDEFSDFMDERTLRAGRGNESPDMQKAQDKLAAKVEELRRAKEELAELEREKKLQKRQDRRVEEQAKPTLTPDLAAQEKDRESKIKFERLNAIVAEGAQERVRLRRELQEKDRENEALRAAAKHSDATEDADEGAAVDVSATQPVRLLEFPKDFGATLASFPRHVGRAAMSRLGRIASGEASAFAGVVQLKAYPSVLRARLADNHRLLFSLLPDRVRVVDLIRRRDLDRRIERLQASGLPASD